MGSISETLGSFRSGEAFAGRTAMTIESLLISGCSQGCEQPLAQVSSAGLQQK